MASKKLPLWVKLLLFIVVPIGIIWFLFFKQLKDKDGNTFKLNRAVTDAIGDYQVMVNGAANGHLATIRKGADGYVHGTSKDGRSFVYINSWRAE